MVPTLPLVPKILVLVFQFLKSWALAPSPSYRGPLVSLGKGVFRTQGVGPYAHPGPGGVHMRPSGPGILGRLRTRRRYRRFPPHKKQHLQLLCAVHVQRHVS